MNLLNQLSCAFRGHTYEQVAQLSSVTSKLRCNKCDRLFAFYAPMNQVIPWTEEFVKIHQVMNDSLKQVRKRQNEPSDPS